MTLDLDRLEALEANATPGPWAASQPLNCPGQVFVVASDAPTDLAHWMTTPDGTLTAEVRNALPELIAAAREREGLRQEIEVHEVIRTAYEAAVKALADQRAAALSRVAELEAALTEIAAVRQRDRAVELLQRMTDPDMNIKGRLDWLKDRDALLAEIGDKQ